MMAGVSAEQMAAALAMYPMMKDAVANERRGREDGRHRHPDDHDDRSREVSRSDRGGGRSRTRTDDAKAARPAAVGGCSAASRGAR